MARYIISHPYEREFLVKNAETGEFDWGPYEEKYVFKNGIEAKEAIVTIPPVLDCYGTPKKLFWMNVTGLL